MPSGPGAAYIDNMPHNTPLDVPTPVRKPDRTYAIMLTVLALFYGMSALSVALAGQFPDMDPTARWAMRYSAAIGACKPSATMPRIPVSNGVARG